MRPSNGTTRRVLLKRFAFGGACFVGVAEPFASKVSLLLGPQTNSRRAMDLVRLAGLDHNGAARLGAAYLRALPGEQNLDRLLATFDTNCPEVIRAAQAGNPNLVRAAVRRQVLHDFGQGEITNVERLPTLARLKSRFSDGSCGSRNRDSNLKWSRK
jgi:hypothetical protein